jgi:hypothetical protein
MVAQSHGNQEHFRKAIDAAQHERNQLIEKLKDLEKIKQRLAQLDTFIEQGKLLVGIETIEVPSEPPPQIEKRKGFGLIQLDGSKNPLYLKAVQLIKEAGRPLGLSEMVEEFRKRNWKLSKDNPRQVLRNTLKAKPEIFSKNEQGMGKEVLYGLRAELPE